MFRPHMDKEASLLVPSLPWGCQSPEIPDLEPAVSVMGCQLSFWVPIGLHDTAIHCQTLQALQCPSHWFPQRKVRFCSGSLDAHILPAKEEESEGAELEGDTRGNLQKSGNLSSHCQCQEAESKRKLLRPGERPVKGGKEMSGMLTA